MWINHRIYNESVQIAWPDLSRFMVVTHAASCDHAIVTRFNALLVLDTVDSKKGKGKERLMLHGGFERVKEINTYNPIPTLVTRCER